MRPFQVTSSQQGQGSALPSDLLSAVYRALTPAVQRLNTVAKQGHAKQTLRLNTEGLEMLVVLTDLGCTWGHLKQADRDNNLMIALERQTSIEEALETHQSLPSSSPSSLPSTSTLNFPLPALSTTTSNATPTTASPSPPPLLTNSSTILSLACEAVISAERLGHGVLRRPGDKYAYPGGVTGVAAVGGSNTRGRTTNMSPSSSSSVSAPHLSQSVTAKSLRALAMSHARTLLEVYHRLGLTETRARTVIGSGTVTRARAGIEVGDMNIGGYDTIDGDSDGAHVDRTSSEVGLGETVGYGWEPLTRRSTMHMLTVTLKLIRDMTLAGDDVILTSDTTATTTTTTRTPVDRDHDDNSNPATRPWRELLDFAKETKAHSKAMAGKTDASGGVKKKTNDVTYIGREGGENDFPMNHHLSLSSSKPLTPLHCEDVLEFLMTTGAEWHSLPTRPRNHLSDALADALVVVPHPLSTSTTTALIPQVTPLDV